MALVREYQRFIRYAFAVQYNGTPFLGFSYQGPNGEDCINDMGVDLRGLHSVEGKIQSALNCLVNGSDKAKMSEALHNDLEKESNYENFQVSSRTDRGVHALKNTFHVDIRSRDTTEQPWQTHQLIRGLNYYLRRDRVTKLNYQWTKQQPPPILTGNEIRILSCKAAPLELIENKHYDPDDENSNRQPSHISWNARFTALRRTYVYRILSHSIPKHSDNSEINSMEGFGIPFEDTRSWRIQHNDSTLNIADMKEASKILVGTNDYSSFRGRNYSRSSPVVTIENITIDSNPIFPDAINLYSYDTSNSDINAKIVTITIQGDAFLYRQVRNIVGCLVEVGKNKLSVSEVREILEARDRTKAGTMAPAHGLFLVNVEHFNLNI
jgi:tRNA pseudouridine(38-40) synthase